MTMQSLINIDGNGLKDVLIDLNDKLVDDTKQQDVYKRQVYS